MNVATLMTLSETKLDATLARMTNAELATLHADLLRTSTSQHAPGAYDRVLAATRRPTVDDDPDYNAKTGVPANGYRLAIEHAKQKATK